MALTDVIFWTKKLTGFNWFERIAMKYSKTRKSECINLLSNIEDWILEDLSHKDMNKLLDEFKLMQNCVTYINSMRVHMYLEVKGDVDLLRTLLNEYYLNLKSIQSHRFNQKRLEEAMNSLASEISLHSASMRKKINSSNNGNHNKVYLQIKYRNVINFIEKKIQFLNEDMISH